MDVKQEFMESMIEPNKLQYLSYSRMDAYHRCPCQWSDVYIFGKPRTDTVFTIFGSIFHETMEVVAQNREMRNEAAALDVFNQVWQEHKLSDMDFYNRGIESVKTYMNRPNAFQYEVIGCEVQFGQDSQGNGTPMEINGVPVVGFIDRVDLVNDKHIIIRDYKTNIMPFSRDEVINHGQMTMYNIIAKRLYPWAKDITLVLDQPIHGEFESYRTDEQLNDMGEYIANSWQQMLYDKTFEPRLNQYCCYCNKRTECETYRRALEMKTAVADPGDYEGMWNERSALAFQKKAIEARMNEIDVAIKNNIAASQQSSITVGRSRFYMTQQRRKEYPITNVKALCEASGVNVDWDACTKLEKTKLMNMPQIKSNGILKTLIEESAEVSYTKPSLACAEVKEEITNS